MGQFKMRDLMDELNHQARLPLEIKWLLKDKAKCDCLSRSFNVNDSNILFEDIIMSLKKQLSSRILK